MSVPPEAPEDGLMLVMAGTGLTIGMVTALEVPPPDAEFTTVTYAVPALSVSLLVRLAINLVELMKLVLRLAPFHCTVDVLTKFVPYTVSAKSTVPAFTEAGLRLVIVGFGLIIVNVRAVDVPPPGGGL